MIWGVGGKDGRMSEDLVLTRSQLAELCRVPADSTAADKRWVVAMHTAAAMDRVLVQAELAARLEGAAGEAVIDATRSDVDQLVADVTRAPVGCEVPTRGQMVWTLLPTGVWVKMPGTPPINPEAGARWGPGEQLTSGDLMVCAAQVQAACETMPEGQIKDYVAEACGLIFDKATSGF
jgi:hypothetical protein